MLLIRADKVQKIKTKWGKYNIDQGRILLNLELVKKLLFCLKYIIVHELLHFKERQHNNRFTALLDTQMIWIVVIISA